ncbi:MAG: hypothetical protein WCA77_02250 [Thermoplasmata archaeon]
MNRTQKGAAIVLTLAITLATISLALMWAPPATHASTSSAERTSVVATAGSLFSARTLATVIHGGSMTPQASHAISPGVSHSIRPVPPASPSGGTTTHGISGYKAMKHCSMGAHDNRLKS